MKINHFSPPRASMSAGLPLDPPPVTNGGAADGWRTARAAYRRKESAGGGGEAQRGLSAVYRKMDSEAHRRERACYCYLLLHQLDVWKRITTRRQRWSVGNTITRNYAFVGVLITWSIYKEIRKMCQVVWMHLNAPFWAHFWHIIKLNPNHKAKQIDKVFFNLFFNLI